MTDLEEIVEQPKYVDKKTVLNAKIYRNIGLHDSRTTESQEKMRKLH